LVIQPAPYHMRYLVSIGLGVAPFNIASGASLQ
jgi:hypothetical protein